MVDVVVDDAGLGEGLGAGDAERARGGVFIVTPAKAGVQGDGRDPWVPGFPLFAGMTAWPTIGVSTRSPVPMR